MRAACRRSGGAGSTPRIWRRSRRCSAWRASGCKGIAGRFDELDAQTGEVMAALRNVSRQREFIREHRDWLFRSQRAWEPILAEWAAFDESDAPEQLWALVGRTYHFLAPRFMPVTEWQSSFRASRESTKRMMTW